MSQTFPDDAMVDVVLPDGTHRYWSTHCRHHNHDACASTELRGTVTSFAGNRGSWPGALQRTPSSCKTCGAPCQCPCGHGKGSDVRHDS